MRKFIKSLIICFAVVLPVIVILSSCSNSDDSSSNSQYISDEQREEHILKLMGGEGSKELTETGYKKMTSAEVKRTGITGVTDMCKIFDNSKFEVYLNFETTALAVYDKNTKAVYHSDPRNMGNEMAKDSPIISSPLALEAYDIMNKRYEFNFIENSLQDKNFKIVKTGDKSIRIVYTIGNDPDKELFPPVVTEDTYNWIYEQLTEKAPDKIRDLTNVYRKLDPDNLAPEDKEYFSKDFPTVDYMVLYVRRSSFNATQKKLVKEAMEAAGFTVEMLKEEMEKAEYQGPERAVMYTIPVDIELDDEGIVVDIDTSLILAPSKQRLYKIYLYRGLGAIKSTHKTNGIADEYMILPDGSGVTMPIAGNITTDSYSERIYGNDETFSSDVVSVKNAQVLSGFGVFDRKGRGSIVSVLEDGAAQAFITARPYNTTNTQVASLNYDLIYSERDYRTYSGTQGSSSSSSSSSDSSGSGVVLSKDQAVANFKVRYSFLEGGKDYSYYADYLQKYLISNGVLPEKKQENAQTSLYIDFYGAIEKSESVAGVPVVNLKPLTTYAQMEEILSKLKENGVGNINARYSYWNNYGYYNLYNNKVRLVDSLGTADELKNLVKYCNDEKIGFFPSTEFMYVYKDTLTDGLSYTDDASRRLDMRLARVNSRSFATGKMSSGGTSYKTILSPDILPKIGQSYKDSFEQVISNKQISFGSLGKYLDSNYKNNRTINRTKALEYQLEFLDLYKDYETLVDTGNDYVWSNASHILNLPMGSSEYLSTTQSIPFIQMILHGYVSYAGEYLNIKADYETSVLKCFETGSNPSFRWMYENDTIFENTEYNEFYSINYNNTFDRAVAIYKEVSQYMDKVASMEITNHSSVTAYLPGVKAVANEAGDNTDAPAVSDETEESQPEDTRISVGNVFSTTYGDKYTVYVNYNDYQVELDDGTVIEAMGYLWR